MKLEFFLPMRPPTVTHQEKQVRVVNGRPKFYEPERLKAARAKLTGALEQHKPAAPLRGPLRLVVKWCFPNTQTSHNGEYKYTRPDTDNLNKLLKDCMTALGFWRDDAQVASEIIEKFWNDVTGIYISIEELSEEDD